MSIRLGIFTACIITFVLTLIFAPIVIKLMRRLHASQSILKYVDNHKDKIGTPTMGGVMFLIPISIVALIFGGVESKIMLVTIGTMLSFGLLGFLDDFIKIRLHHNEGLKPYQKIIGQVGIGVIITVFAYMDSSVGTGLKVPFVDKIVDFGVYYIPFTLFVFLATTNAVNLTDGIDGLATSTTMIYVVTFIVILVMGVDNIEGDTVKMNDAKSMIILLSSIVGGLMAFYLFNTNKATIFMGDTGSLALGGIVGAVAVFTHNTLLIPIVGIMYMVTCISVIIQVFYFKITHGKRIFIMAPLHHHLQYKGMSESKIVALYSVITALFGMLALVSI